MGKVVIVFFSIATIVSGYLTYTGYGQNSIETLEEYSIRSNSYHGGSYGGGSYNSSGYSYGK